MRTSLIVGLLAVSFAIPARRVSAVPTALFAGSNAAGYQGISIKNDTGSILQAIILKSGNTPLGQRAAGVSLTGIPLEIPGAILDRGDQPNAIVYLSFPKGTHFIGYILDPSANFCGPDLTVEYYPASATSPIQQGAVQICPEPSSVTLAGLGLVAVFACRRR